MRLFPPRRSAELVAKELILGLESGTLSHHVDQERRFLIRQHPFKTGPVYWDRLLVFLLGMIPIEVLIGFMLVSHSRLAGEVAYASFGLLLWIAIAVAFYLIS